MRPLGLDKDVVDERVRARAVEHFRALGISLPSFAQLADPATVPVELQDELAAVDPDEPHPLNLWRVHWHNSADRRGRLTTPDYVVLPETLTGVAAPIVVALGDRFPMIRAHKVLAAYGCLLPRLLTGRFDPTRQRAVWPSTGNYCRGGVAISRVLGCRGVAVLPEGMSEERFRWLDEWVSGPEDIVRTPGTESNVKEIYDVCAELEQDPENVIFNQFCEFANHLVHFECTGRALERVYLAERERRPGLELAAFVSATGSAGTIGAGDYLKERFGTRIAAAEALECPTLYSNGFGEHNIQGIGDKHVPLIHNVQNTDFVVDVSDRSTDELNVLFNTDVGKSWLAAERGLTAESVKCLEDFGLSGICNVLGAIKVAKHLGLGAASAVITVATDGAALYRTEVGKALAKYFPGGFDREDAARTFATHLEKVGIDHMLELGALERDRIFNLGYFTWVEQQGVALEDFERRRSQAFWQELRALIPAWDAEIASFNAETGAVASP